MAEKFDTMKTADFHDVVSRLLSSLAFAYLLCSGGKKRKGALTGRYRQGVGAI